MSGEPEVSCDECGRAFSDIMEGRGNSLFHQLVQERVSTRENCQRCYGTYRKTTELCQRQLTKLGPPQLGDRLIQFLRDKTDNDG